MMAHACVENRPIMLSDVVAVYIPKDAPRIKPSVQGLVVPCNSLHHPVLSRVAVFVRALYLVRAPDVAVVGHDALSWLEAVCENAVKTA